MPQLLLAYLITTLPNAKITHVPFPGAAQALTATMSSQTELAVVTLPPAVPLVTSGKLKGLAVTTPQRSAAVPAGADGGRGGLSRACPRRCGPGSSCRRRRRRRSASKIGAAVLKVAAMPEIREKLMQLGFEPTSISGDQFQRDVAVEVKHWAEVIQKAGHQGAVAANHVLKDGSHDLAQWAVAPCAVRLPFQSNDRARRPQPRFGISAIASISIRKYDSDRRATAIVDDGIGRG